MLQVIDVTGWQALVVEEAHSVVSSWTLSKASCSQVKRLGPCAAALEEACDSRLRWLRLILRRHGFSTRLRCSLTWSLESQLAGSGEKPIEVLAAEKEEALLMVVELDKVL